jgi:hypothetical protein
MDAVPDKRVLERYHNKQLSFNDILHLVLHISHLKMSLSLNLTIDDFDPIIGESRDSSADDLFC